MNLGFRMVPEDLGRITVLILGYGAVCTVFGIVFGYVVGPSIARRCRIFSRWLRNRRWRVNRAGRRL